jgi:predicted RNA-binding protein
MCESNAYLIKDDEEELLLEDVARIKPEEDGTLSLVSILGERKTLKGTIVEIDLMAHRILLSEQS